MSWDFLTGQRRDPPCRRRAPRGFLSAPPGKPPDRPSRVWETRRREGCGVVHAPGSTLTTIPPFFDSTHQAGFQLETGRRGDSKGRAWPGQRCVSGTRSRMSRESGESSLSREFRGGDSGAGKAGSGRAEEKDLPGSSALAPAGPQRPRPGPPVPGGQEWLLWTFSISSLGLSGTNEHFTCSSAGRAA